MQHTLLFLPELVTLVVATVLFVALILNIASETIRRLALVGGVAMVVGAAVSLGYSGEPFFPGIYHSDFFSQVLKLIFSAVYLMLIVIGEKPTTLARRAWGELPLFIAVSTVGMMMLVSATELATLYLALELSAYPIYILVALHRKESLSGEAGTKYMLQGMVASAVTLYGISLLFGLSGSTYLADIAQLVASGQTTALFWTALLLTLSGFLFKLAFFPFHIWAADTYQASPHPVTAFVATASKLATIAVLCRLIVLVSEGTAESSGAGFRFMLMWFSVIAMTMGNLAALVQKDLKRLLGYSAIAHAGYLGIGLQAFSQAGITSVLFYTIGYLAMSFLCFLVVCEVGRKEDLVTIDSLSGLWNRSPFLALCLLVGVLGLTGLPPTVGFIGKWFLFSAALEQGQFLLVLFASINAVVATYYYLRVIKVSFTGTREDEPIAPSSLVIATGLFACAVVLWMGSAPTFFHEIAQNATTILYR